MDSEETLDLPLEDNPAQFPNTLRVLSTRSDGPGGVSMLVCTRNAGDIKLSWNGNGAVDMDILASLVRQLTFATNKSSIYASMHSCVLSHPDVNSISLFKQGQSSADCEHVCSSSIRLLDAPLKQKWRPSMSLILSSRSVLECVCVMLCFCPNVSSTFRVISSNLHDVKDVYQ